MYSINIIIIICIEICTNLADAIPNSTQNKYILKFILDAKWSKFFSILVIQLQCTYRTTLLLTNCTDNDSEFLGFLVTKYCTFVTNCMYILGKQWPTFRKCQNKRTIFGKWWCSGYFTSAHFWFGVLKLTMGKSNFHHFVLNSYRNIKLNINAFIDEVIR